MISHETYLQSILLTKQLELSEANIANRIAIARYNSKTELLSNDIASIEKQLESNKKVGEC